MRWLADHPGVHGQWQVVLELGPEVLRTLDPLPLLMQRLMEIEGLRMHRECLSLVLAELFSNALEHGLLGLDSTLKQTPQGFATYYAERQRRLAALQNGQIKITLTHALLDTGGKLVLQVEDSGPGFDYHTVLSQSAAHTGYHGRGIQLVRALCQQLIYHGKGNRVEAVYVWQEQP